jgi:hypothetical protein
MVQNIEIGVDFDGTVCTELDRTWFYRLMWKLFPRIWIEISHRLARRTKFVVPWGSYIITGRPGWMKNLTLKQMKRWGLEDCTLIIDEAKVQIGVGGTKWKIDNIRRLGIDIFYENSPGVAKRIKREFPDKRIILVDELSTPIVLENLTN